MLGRLGRRGLVVLGWGLLGLLALGASPAAAEPEAGAGFAVSEYASEFPTGFRFGPMGLAFEGSGRLFAVDNTDSNLYAFGAAGGAASSALVSSDPIPGYLVGLTFDGSGNLFVTRQLVPNEGDVTQINPVDGSVLRVVASGFKPLGIATDPRSGDLFIARDDGPLLRIAEPASGAPSVTNYGPFLSSPDGLAFGPDGTIYVEDQGEIEQIDGTDSASPGTSTSIAFVPEADGIAVAETTNPSEPGFLAVNSNDGSITKVELGPTPGGESTIMSGGTRGDLVTVGPDRCLYASQLESIEKVTAADGTCPFYPSGPFHCSSAVASVSPASGRVSEAGQPGTTVTIHGRGFCAGTSVEFGNRGAAVAAHLSGAGDLTAIVPRTATSAGLKLTTPEKGHGAAFPFAVDSYRNTNGFRFGNDTGSRGDVSFSDVAAAFGAAAYQHFIPCAGCKPATVPTDAAEQILKEARSTLAGGLCYGFAMGSLRLSQGLDKLAATVDPRRTDAAWNEPDTWALPGWETAAEPYASQMRHYLYAQAIRQYSVQVDDQLAEYSEGLSRTRQKARYLYDTVRRDLTHGFALINLSVDYYDPGKPHILPWLHNATDGHAVVAYELGPLLPDGSFGIEVYDPNRPFELAEETDSGLHEGQLYGSEIHVDSSGNWSFDGQFAGAAGRVWHGNPSGIWSTPFNAIRGPLTPRGGGGGSHAVLSGGQVEQLTDAKGRSLFDAHGELQPEESRPDAQVVPTVDAATTALPVDAQPAILVPAQESFTEQLGAGAPQSLYAPGIDGSVTSTTGGEVKAALGDGKIAIKAGKGGAQSLRLTRRTGSASTTVQVSGTVGALAVHLGRTGQISGSGSIHVSVTRSGPGAPHTFTSSVRLKRGETLQLGSLSRFAARRATVRLMIVRGRSRRAVDLRNHAAVPTVEILRARARRAAHNTVLTLRLRARRAAGGTLVLAMRAGHVRRTITLVAAGSRSVTVKLPRIRTGRSLALSALAVSRSMNAGPLARRTVRVR